MIYNKKALEDDGNLSFQNFVGSSYLLKYILNVSYLEKIQPYNLVGTSKDNMAVMWGKGIKCDLKIDFSLNQGYMCHAYSSLPSVSQIFGESKHLKMTSREKNYENVGNQEEFSMWSRNYKEPWKTKNNWDQIRGRN